MTTEIQTREIVRSYHNAWVAGDVTAAGAFLADEFTHLTPMSNYYNRTDYLESLRAFRQLVAGLDMISELYGDAEATLVYEVHTATPIGTSRVAEHFRLTDGKISSITLIFDATAWHAMTPAGQ